MGRSRGVSKDDSCSRKLGLTSFVGMGGTKALTHEVRGQPTAEFKAFKRSGCSDAGPSTTATDFFAAPTSRDGFPDPAAVEGSRVGG